MGEVWPSCTMFSLESTPVINTKKLFINNKYVRHVKIAVWAYMVVFPLTKTTKQKCNMELDQFIPLVQTICWCAVFEGGVGRE